MSYSLIKINPVWLLPFVVNSALAGAITDGSLGAVQNLSGKFVIPQSLGTTRGANLFHSFEKFSIDSGEQARFTSNAAINHIIARVTGGSSSQINGLLQVSGDAGSTPNFYLINPAGIVFGAGAQIDVPGSFFVSTANYLRFKDGEFHADLSRSSSLSVAAPEAFGFLGKPAAAIKFEPGAQITINNANQVHLSAASIQFEQASLFAPGAEISLQTTSQATELKPGQSAAQLSGQVSLTAGSQLSSSSQDSRAAGNILIQSAQINLDGKRPDQPDTEAAETAILANARAAATRSGDIQIQAEQVQILNSARISSSSFNAADAGNISLQGKNLKVDGAGTLSGLFSQANQNTNKLSGKAGQIDVNLTQDLKLLNGAQISASTYSDQPAGGVKVNAQTIVLDGSEARGPDTGILSISYAGKGNAGNIEVNARALLQIRASAQISSATQAQGNAANVLINAGKLEIHGDGISTGINSLSYGVGKAGNLTININGDALLQNYGGISSTTFAGGAAGTINFQANNLTINGQRGEAGIYSDSGDFRMSASYAGGDAGTIKLKIGDKISLRDGGKISSTTYTRGRSGTIQLEAGQLSVQGESAGIFAETIGQGDAGNIQIAVQNNAELAQGGQISSSTRFAGKGGQLELKAQNLTIKGPGSAILSDASTGAQQDAGAIQLQVQNDLQVLDGGQISSATNSYQAASAGAVRIKAGQILLDGKRETTAQDANVVTGIFSSANTQDADLYSAGHGGAINLEADKLIIKNQAAIATDTNARGSAGKIEIRVKELTLERAEIRSEAGQDSAGQVGSLDLQVAGKLQMDQAKLSINNLAERSNQVELSQLNLQAAEIYSRSSEISAAASAKYAASALNIGFQQRWINQQSRVNTSAMDGDGGKITILGQGGLVLQQSQITTSVSGKTQGNGGDIMVSAPVLVLANGMVQANTFAAAASGGLIQMRVPTLLAQAQQLQVGGQAASGNIPPKFGNLIQAAAPDGVNGEIRLASSPVDLNSSLLKLDLKLPDLAEILADLCRNGVTSSFSVLGRGSLPASSLGWLTLPSP